jgi:hypothetical protein
MIVANPCALHVLHALDFRIWVDANTAANVIYERISNKIAKLLKIFEDMDLPESWWVLYQH